MNLFKYGTIASIIMIMTGCGNTNDQDKTMTENNPTKAIELSNMDTTIAPGNDFFRYANGGWIASNPIPDEYSRFGAFEVLDKMNKQRIKDLIEEVSKVEDAAEGTPQQQIRDFYNAAMDTAAINARGYQPIASMLAKINNMQNINELPNILADMNLKGMHPAIILYAAQDEKQSDRVIANLTQGGLTLPDRDYYTSDDPRSQEIRTNYISYTEKMLGMVGYTETDAKAAAEKIMSFETRLAKVSMTRLERRDPNKTYNLFNISDFKTELSNFDFQAYLTGLGIGDIKVVNVHQPKFYKELNAMIMDMPIEAWKEYLKWKVLNGNASLLSADFEQAKFDFFGKKLSGTQKMQERWKRIVSSVNGNLGEAMGKLYVEKYFPQEAKDRMIELVNNLKISLGESIKNLDWMSEETKIKANEKLNAITVKVGYPNKWKDYSSIKIVADNNVQNSWNCSKFGYEYNLNKIGKPVDREEWGMTPQTVNAYYSPNMNEIVFPAAILQPPFFDMNADDAVNYGSIGVVIGHEMTHGFDDQGRLYDKEGNLNDWWTPEDAKKFKAKTQILVNQYSKYEVLDSLHVNGELTLGENIADNGGLFIAHNALLKSYEKNGTPKDIDGLTYNQRFLISYAQVWRQSLRDKELMRRLKEDVHSPGEARVNAGVANLPWWYEAFNIQEGDKYYIAPEERAKIW